MSFSKIHCKLNIIYALFLPSFPWYTEKYRNIVHTYCTEGEKLTFFFQINFILFSIWLIHLFQIKLSANSHSFKKNWRDWRNWLQQCINCHAKLPMLYYMMIYIECVYIYAHTHIYITRSWRLFSLKDVC